MASFSRAPLDQSGLIYSNTPWPMDNKVVLLLCTLIALSTLKLIFLIFTGKEKCMYVMHVKMLKCEPKCKKAKTKKQYKFTNIPLADRC
jgi:hypothetical protein